MGIFRTKLDFSDNRQVKQRIETTTNLSGATTFGVPYSDLPTGPNLTLSSITQTINGVYSTFSGNNTTTNYTWYDSNMSIAESTLSAYTPSNSGITQGTGYVFIPDVSSYFNIDGNTGYTQYSGVSYDVQVTNMDDLGGGAYSGDIYTSILYYIAANGLDFTGRTIWNDVSGITRTNRLIITDNPQVGYVWTCLDSEGMGGWTPVSGSSSGSTIWTAGTGVNSAVLGGSNGIASGSTSVSEGKTTIAGGIASHAEGEDTFASGDRSHAEGKMTLAYGNASHAEGADTVASGVTSHAEGEDSIASGYAAHAEGKGTVASGDYSHAEGYGDTMGYPTASGTASHAEGYATLASGNYSHAQGYRTIASGSTSHAEGDDTTAIGVASHAEGYNTIASGDYSHAEGYYSLAFGDYSHAEGGSNLFGASGGTASGIGSHAEGVNTIASGDYSHAEGAETVASGGASHAEGQNTLASNDFAHAEGVNTIASESASHAEGEGTIASNLRSHAEGYYSRAIGQGSHAEGGWYDGSVIVSGGTAIGNASHAEGASTVSGWRGLSISSVSSGLITISDNIDYTNLFQCYSLILDNTIYSYSSTNYTAPDFTIQLYDTEVNDGYYVADICELGSLSATTIFGNFSHAEGYLSSAYGEASHAENAGTAYGPNSHAEGNSTAKGEKSHAEGEATIATGIASHAEGRQTIAFGNYSHAQGYQTIASGDYSHAQGQNTIASGDYSHAEGYYSLASGDYSHAEGGGYDGITGGTAGNIAAHAEGMDTLASGYASHAEGYGSIAEGNYSHAEGSSITTVSGSFAHAEGVDTTASGATSHVEGDSSIAGGDVSHAQGTLSEAYGKNSHVGGYRSKVLINTAISDNSFVHSDTSTIESSSNSVILGGYNHLIDLADKSAIIGGEHNEIKVNIDILTNPVYSGIFVGKDNTIIPKEGYAGMSASYCAIVGGQSNTISGHSHSFIGGGYNNLIACDGNYNAIIAGQNNTNHAANGVIIGGQSNTLGDDPSCPSSADNSIIVGGKFNFIISTISNNADNCIILGGQSNVIDSTSGTISNSVILGGSDITATTSNTVYVPDLVIDGLISATPLATDASGKIIDGTSDARLKQNVNILTNSLNTIKNLRGVSFEYTPESNMGGGVRYGFIAQEVQEHVPNIVRNRVKGDGMLSLNYNEIVPILVEAVKELATGITTSNNTHLETQTVLAEDNNIELNFNGTQQTALGGGLTVLHAKGQDQSANLITDSDGNFVTNNDFKPQALTIPLYTPTSSNDTAGSEGNITRDDNYMYVKTSTGWKRTNLENF